MTRHSKNCTANSVYSYHEKQSDAKASGFGSLQQRFSKDAIKDYDCCCLTLHPCTNPVLTPDGFLYDKEAILEYIIAKKNEISRKLKEYEKQCKKEKSELEELGEAERRSKLEKFLRTETGVATNLQASKASGGEDKREDVAQASVSNMSTGKEKQIPSFWIPSLTPENKQTSIQKPDTTVYCPMSGRPLKMRDLIPVKFTLAEEALSKGSLDGKQDRYKCPISGDILRNNVPCAMLRPTGHVVTMDAVEVIKKDMIHPMTNQKLTERDIIPLQRGGTGFAGVNVALVAKKARPVMQT